MARADRRRGAPGGNFAERLAQGGLLNARGVPKESGRQFFIDAAVRDEGLCFIFQIDGNDALNIPAEQPRPDYLVLFIGFDRPDWLFTIVEMKGRDLSRGVQQIESFYRSFRSQIEAVLPTATRAAWQGILLHAQNADIPRDALSRSQRSPCPIRPVASHHQADLYPYVRARLAPSQRVPAHRGRNLPAPGCFNALEALFACSERQIEADSTPDSLKIAVSNRSVPAPRLHLQRRGGCRLHAPQAAAEVFLRFPERCRESWTLEVTPA